MTSLNMLGRSGEDLGDSGLCAMGEAPVIACRMIGICGSVVGAAPGSSWLCPCLVIWTGGFRGFTASPAPLAGGPQAEAQHSTQPCSFPRVTDREQAGVLLAVSTRTAGDFTPS